MSLFKRNLLIGFGVSLLLLIASSAASYISINNLLHSSGMVNHTNIVINRVGNILSILKDAETGARGFLLTGNDQFLEPYNGAQDKAARLINETKQLLSDNPQQLVDCDLLNTVVLKRLNILASMINAKRRGEVIPDSMLLESKSYMDQARKIVDAMQQRERTLLEERTSKMQQFAASTPVFIIIASILAVIVTLVSFMRVLQDYSKRTALQEALQNKDIEISNRILAVQGIADQIAAGDYTLKVTDEGRDALGNIAGSLNKMAASLDQSFTFLKEQEWFQKGVAQLNQKLIGERNLEALTQKTIDFLTEYTKAQVGAFYLVKDNSVLALSAAVAIDRSKVKPLLSFGEAMPGEVARTGKEIWIQNVGDVELSIDYTGGRLKPSSIALLPVFYEDRLKGVIELASLDHFSNTTFSFLKASTYNIGNAIHSALDHQRLQDLLHETQAQSEELQAQHNELQNLNAELEAQAEKLQTSEEELKVQQEELQQANQELEERSRLLEEKNELILERNLQIQAKADDLAQSTRYKSEFLANMSHELRTPLNSILLLSRLLSENHEGNLSGDQIEYANVIQNSGKGLLTLIDEILDLSKIEAGKMELEFGDIRIDAMVNEIRSLFAPIATEKGIEFKIEREDRIPEVFESDKLRVEQVLRNLISNALKFTKKGSVTLQIARKGQALSFAVIDTGIGIPGNKQQTIFEAFQQADGSTRRQYGGTGLGLSISRELARLLGGEISLESEEGKGSTFTLLLPMNKGQELPEKSDPKQENNTASILQEKAALKENIQPAFLSKIIPEPVPDDRDAIHPSEKSILIIEDDTAFAKVLLDYTRKKGYKGVVAVRGDEGIALAKQIKPLGILLDVQLPVKNGWEVMDELKADPSVRHIPVHMMSSHEVKNKSLLKGAVDFINKPVAFDQLGEVFARIEKALNDDLKKVLIVEENPKHAQALAYFLEGYNVNAEIKNSITEGVKALNKEGVNCVILDMGIPTNHSYEVLEQIKKTPGFENLPIIIFTGKNLSHVEERKIRQYADSIVIKTAQSYQRILDEVSLFLHLVEENKKNKGDRSGSRNKMLGSLDEVLRNKTVLLVDDDVRNIFSLTRSLENHGMNVVSAVDGKEALAQLDANPSVDLVLMDMMMPEMDGYESTKNIRANPKYRNLPVIAVTAKAMTGDREKCMSAGASDYITKPVDVDQLLSLLRVWLYEG